MIDEKQESVVSENESLRTRIAKVLYRCDYGERDFDGVIDKGKQPYYDDADAVIRELESDRDELVKEAIRDLQEKYILVPKSQTLAEMSPPRLVATRDCTPLELPADWTARE
jgi:hypothetical protein